MTKIDTSLIYLRAENARMSLRELGQQLKKSSQRLKYALKMLEKEEILKEPHCVFDYSYFGLILFRVYFRGVYVSEQEKNRIIKELSQNPYVVAIYGLEGEFDLAVELASPNPSRFNKELRKLLQITPALNNYKVILNLVTHIHPRHYLVKNEYLRSLNREKVVGGDREKESFEAGEIKVIKNLFLNPKIRLTELAKKTDLNVKTANSLLKNLMRRNIIRGFEYVLDIDKLGIHKYRLFLRLHNLSLEKENQLKDYIFRTSEVVQINRTVGDWDMELDLESLDKSKIRYFTMKLREDFKEIIEKYNLIEFYNYYKKAYLPLYLFEEEKNQQ